MNLSCGFSVDWHAPVVPGVSLAAIPLLAPYADLEVALATHLVDANLLLYKFNGGPDLRLEKHLLDEYGDGGFLFSLFCGDDGSNMAALSISIKGWAVRAIKVYALGEPGDAVTRYSYRGLTAESIGLGSLVSDFIGFTELYFDEAEEWFYSQSDYGAIEVTGWGVPLEDEPQQIVTAICVTV
ncbi:hypothetical protein [Stenotrophomonas indicatrix]|uniref:hypothetical protein n=1 Tax=Stenotrophomonas indicatrix TaxID=2045451 RepID=UPI0013DD11EC|nr:hypothetical protein [Stenotrophomonas indicatrix]